jgi:hypothetical protein
MAWAEDLAVDMGTPAMDLTSKRSGWGRRRASDYPKMIAFARDLGITLPAGRLAEDVPIKQAMRARELSDLINRVQATQRVDPIAGRIKRRPA